MIPDDEEYTEETEVETPPVVEIPDDLTILDPPMPPDGWKDGGGWQWP